MGDVLKPMPQDVTYGRVKGDVSEFIADVTSDGKPDRRAVQGMITFRPSVKFVVDTTTGGVIYTNPDPVTIKDDGTIDVMLVATDAPNLNPTDWHYVVEIKPPGKLPLEAPMRVPGGTTSLIGDVIDVTKAVTAGSTIVTGGEGPRGEPGPPGPPGPVSSEGYKVLAGASGAVSVDVKDAATYAVDLAGDVTLTIAGVNGQTVALDVVANGHVLTLAQGPTITADGLYALLRSRDAWKPGG